MSRALFCLGSLVALLVLFAPSAQGAGGPMPYDTSPDATAVAPNGEGPRYATVSNGRETTILQIDQDGGEILGRKTIDGVYAIPVVAVDGTAGGISGDGSRLILAESRWVRFQFPREQSRFVVVDIRSDGRMRAQPPLTFRGDFSFDALSPDGLHLYLTEYLSRDLNNYALREYDFAQQRLLPDPVLVAHEVSPGEMRGVPTTRTTSPDGRWEYTLYNGGGRRNDEAFIHTLDTERGISHCVDLAMVDGQEALRAGLELTDDAGTLNVTRGGQTLAMLNTETFGLSEPLAPELTVEPESGGGPSGLAIGAIVAGTVLLIGTALGLRRRRQAAALPQDPFGPGEPDAPEEAESQEEETEPEPERDRVST
jgi:hypothetical protein